MTTTLIAQGDIDDRVIEELEARGYAFVDYFDRMLEHDWGDISEIQSLANDAAVENGGAVNTFYEIDGAGDGVELRYDLAAHRYTARYVSSIHAQVGSLS